MFGLDALANLLDERAQQPNWDGYLFPTDAANRSFLSPSQMRRRFKDLCRKAGVDVDGDVGTPKHGRAFYYNILADAESDLLETAGEIAGEQGANDAKAVRDFYLTQKNGDDTGASSAHPSNPARRRPHRVQHPYQPRQLI